MFIIVSAQQIESLRSLTETFIYFFLTLKFFSWRLFSLPSIFQYRLKKFENPDWSLIHCGTTELLTDLLLPCLGRLQAVVATCWFCCGRDKAGCQSARVLERFRTRALFWTCAVHGQRCSSGFAFFSWHKLNVCTLLVVFFYRYYSANLHGCVFFPRNFLYLGFSIFIDLEEHLVSSH